MLQPSLFRLFVYRYNAHLPDAMQNVNGCINPRVAERLSVQPPSAYMVQTYLEKICDEHQVDWKPKVPLKADEIANPMSAPSGYSVQVGGGSGINASEFVEGGLPANGGSGGASAPPLSPSSYGNLPVAPNSSQQQKQQQSAYVPVLPKPASSAAVPSKIDDIEEEDIFIPGAPTTAPGGPGQVIDDDSDEESGGGGGEEGARVRTQSAGEQSKDDVNGGGGSGGGDESYDDLAARFAMLQK